MSLAGMVRICACSPHYFYLPLIDCFQPYALALALLSIFLIFIVELVAMRWGTAKLSSLGIVHDPHTSTHAHPPLCLEPSEPHTADGTSSDQLTVTEREKEQDKSISTSTLDLEHAFHHTTTTAPASAQLVGIAILEFGVVLHSFLIGLTLAVTENFKILFIVLVFHRTSLSFLLTHTN